MPNALPTIASFWHGSALGPSAAACLVSFVRQGHRVVLYSYAPLNLPPGIEPGDANDVLPWGWLAEVLEAGAHACASDVFRYAILARGLGIWVDTTATAYGRSRMLPASMARRAVAWAPRS